MFKEFALLGAAAVAAITGYATDAFGVGQPEAVEGRIYHYVRSNQDGSGAENVYLYRAAYNRLEIYKSSERCVDAGFVTAWVDSETGNATVIQGGRLMPEARHENFATISYDGAATMLRAEAALPDRMVRQQVRVTEPIFHLYDADLATLSVQTMGLDDPRQGFSFALPTIWTEPEDGQYVRHLGEANAEFVRAEEYQGTPALRFDVTGSAFGDNGGPLWLDAQSGHVLGAQWGIPNRPGMDDFSIRLVETEDSGDAGWQALLTDHFAGCPTV